ncbi:MAG: hydroxymethylglutaryl-CoA reductase [Rickettsia sp.]|nr:hydroxymethylglutaryl-CoA reductase [Rickettsia sp.]
MIHSDDLKIPTKIIGPIKIKGLNFDDSFEEVMVPLSSFEQPLWNSVQRGALISQLLPNAIETFVIEDSMTRSIILETDSAKESIKVKLNIENDLEYFNNLISNHSKNTQLKSWHTELVGNLIYIRFKFFTKEASGHNMSTYAAQIILDDLLKRYKHLKYISISGNICTDKKNSAINGIIGRGKYIIAQISLPQNICKKYLRSDIYKIYDINVKKNLLGSILSGGVRTANAHFANMLLAFYLSTGQDAANIVEGSQGFVHVDIKEEYMHFSVTLPNVIIGTIGNGKNNDLVKKNLALMGIDPLKENSAKKLAMIVGSVVLCGELSLLAAQTNRGELLRSHTALERKKIFNG